MRYLGTVNMKAYGLLALHPVRSVAKRVRISPIRLVVNEDPLVLSGPVAQAVVEEGKRVGILAVTVRHWLLALLTTTIKVRVEEPMASEYANHASHCHGGHPPIIVGRWICKPAVEHVLVEVICHCWICLAF